MNSEANTMAAKVIHNHRGAIVSMSYLVKQWWQCKFKAHVFL